MKKNSSQCWNGINPKMDLAGKNNLGDRVTTEYYFFWSWKEDDEFEKFVNGRKKFDDWMVIPRNMASKLNEVILRTLVAQFKDDE